LVTTLTRMPELPEVEPNAQLAPLVQGAAFVACTSFIPSPPTAISHTLAKLREGRRILDASRHGKYLLLVVDRGLIEMHFRFAAS